MSCEGDWLRSIPGLLLLFFVCPAGTGGVIIASVRDVADDASEEEESGGAGDAVGAADGAADGTSAVACPSARSIVTVARSRHCADCKGVAECPRGEEEGGWMRWCCLVLECSYGRLLHVS